MQIRPFWTKVRLRWQVRWLLFLAVAVGAVGFDEKQGSAASFFPTRPASGIQTLKGVLVDYGVGGDSGGFDIMTASGSVNIAVGANMKVNGVRLYCTIAPSSTYTPLSCPDWPSNIIVGQTTVVVHYWQTTLNGVSIYASDQIDVSKS